MRWHLVVLPATAMLSLSLAVSRNTPHTPSDGAEPPSRRLEVERLRAHFDSVDVELRAPDPAGLAPRQRASRATLIGWLREYREAGRFPLNDRFPGRAVPIFRDGRGALCAMAYLIERSGRGDLVDRVASTRNYAFIGELADDPAVRGWLDSVGFSVAEAARVQPEYDGEGGLTDDSVSEMYELTSVLVSGASITSLGFNILRPSKLSGWAGVVAGSVALIAGGAELDGNDKTRNFAKANMIFGGAAVVGGLYRLVRPPQPDEEDTPPAVAPVVIRTSDGPRLGLAMRASF